MFLPSIENQDSLVFIEEIFSGKLTLTQRATMKILVVDDNYQDIAPLLNVYFKGDEVTYVATPHVASIKLSDNRYDLMILDGELSSCEGPEALQAWQSMGLELPPVVMFSASEKMRKKGLEVGAVFAISKEDCTAEDFAEARRRAK
ncbi:MAG: response regulator [Patescibacteria group bacterium]